MGSIAEFNKNLAAGLNSRAATKGGAGRKRSHSAMKKSNLLESDEYFDQDDEEGDENGNNKTARGSVNQDISTVQGEVRRRAAATEAAAQTNGIYDYDGQYELFAKGANRTQEKGGGTNEESKTAKKSHFGLNARGGTTSSTTSLGPSRYISKMMETANKRRQQNEIAFERKITRERLVEEKENGDDFQDKEQFVTKSYQRKLQQRAEFLKQQQEEEARQDAENQKGVNRKGPAAGFGNLLRNTLYQKPAVSKPPSDPPEKSVSESNSVESNANAIHQQPQGQAQPKLHTSRWGAPPPVQRTNNTLTTNAPYASSQNIQGDNKGSVAAPTEEELDLIRASRIQKVLAARTRYLERRRLAQAQEN